MDKNLVDINLELSKGYAIDLNIWRFLSKC